MNATQATRSRQGLTADAGLTYSLRLGPLLLAGGPDVTVTDGRYARVNYGVSAAQSAASGYRQYTPSGGVEKAGLGLTAVMPLTRSVSLTALAGYQRLLGDAADSPIVRGRGGARDQISGGVFLSYRLY